MKNKGERFNKLVTYLLVAMAYVFLYTFVFLFVDLLFDSFVIDPEHIYIYSFVSVILLLALTYTIKPILFKITLPLTGLTFGLFYFVNNMIILKLIEYIMGGVVKFTSLPILFFISIVFSILNFIINDVIMRPINKKVEKLS